MNTSLWNMGSGFAAAQRPGMTCTTGIERRVIAR
jgi:hypothetical protein